MEESILKSTKKILGVGDDDTSFDLDIITHINSAFSTLTDLGVGPEAGFTIIDDTAEWGDYIVDDVVETAKVKTCVQLNVRLLFDPPTVGFLLESIKNQLAEMQWRLNTNREIRDWVAPVEEIPNVIDGGDAG